MLACVSLFGICCRWRCLCIALSLVCLSCPWGHKFVVVVVVVIVVVVVGVVDDDVINVVVV